jgi:RNA polymerase sigma-70 factor (ECF subfamily)
MVFIETEEPMRDFEQAHLLERLQAGDEQALAELAAAYRFKIYKLAFRYLRNKEDAEEVVQDVLYKVFRSIGSFRGDSALSSWIYRITFNAAMSRLRTARYRQSHDDDRHIVSPEGEESIAAAREVADLSDMADDRILRSQLRGRVFRAILALPAIYRAPVMLRDIQGMSTEEASAMLHVKDQTLKSRLHRGRLILRKQLADFAGGLTLHRPVYGT